MRIIYVEDNPANIALVERICRMNKDELATYNDPLRALDGVEGGMADLILMDVNLGEDTMNGLELTRKLRDKGVAEPIVIVTAYDAMGYPDHFQAAGFNEYVLKPVSVRGMIDLINAYRPAPPAQEPTATETVATPVSLTTPPADGLNNVETASTPPLSSLPVPPTTSAPDDSTPPPGTRDDSTPAAE